MLLAAIQTHSCITHPIVIDVVQDIALISITLILHGCHSTHAGILRLELLISDTLTTALVVTSKAAMSKLIIRSQDNECPHAGTILAYHDTDPS